MARKLSAVERARRARQSTGRLVYNVPEAGKMAGLTRNGSYEAARNGSIPTIKFGKLRKVPAAAWERMLAGE